MFKINFVTKNYIVWFKIVIVYIWQQNMSPTRLELILIGSTKGLNNSHTYPIAAPSQPSNAILRQGIPWIIKGYTKLVCTADIPRISSIPVQSLYVYNNVRIRAPVRATALFQQSFRQGNTERLPKSVLGDWWHFSTESLLVLANIYYRGMSVQRLIPMVIIQFIVL